MAARAVSRESLRDWGRALLWLQLLLAPVLFSTRTTEAFELPKLALLKATAAVLLVFGVAVSTSGAGPPLLERARRAAAEPLALGVLLSLASAAVSTATSLSPRTSLLGAEGSFAGLLTMAALTVLFFAARALCASADAAHGVLSGAALGLGLCVVYAAVQLLGLDPLRWQAPIVFSGVSRVFSTQGHPNSLAQLLATAVPVTAHLAASALRARRRGEAGVLGLAAVGGVALAALTLSRAGVLALGAGMLVLAAGGATAPSARQRGLVLSGLFGLAALGVVLAALPAGSGLSLAATRERLARLGADGLWREEPRRFLWSAAWATFREHPLAGAGLDCFSLAYARQRTPASWLAEWGQTPFKAHSAPLELLATRGLLGGIAATLGVFGAGLALARASRPPGPETGLAFAASAGLAGFAVHSLFNYPTAAGSSLASVLAGILSVRSAPRAAPAAAPVTLARVLAAAFVAAAVVHGGVLTPLRADVLAHAATGAIPAEPARAAAYAADAVRLDATRPLLWFRLSAAYQAAGLAETDSARRKRLLEDARRAASGGVERAPLEAYGHAHLGALLGELERETPPLARREEVERAFSRARELDPHNSFVLMAAATAALAAGDRPRAVDWATACLRLYPRFAPPRGLLGAVALAAGREWLAAGEKERARAELAGAFGLLQAALAADWKGDEAALAAAAANRHEARELLASLD